MLQVVDAECHRFAISHRAKVPGDLHSVLVGLVHDGRELIVTYAGVHLYPRGALLTPVRDGTARLLTRGVVRLDPPAYDEPEGELRLGLFGNHWRVPAGHRLRVDLAQVDEPTFRRANPPTTLSFTEAELVLPVR